MRLILMFDLPMISDKDKNQYVQFRKFLIKNGFLMIQYSIYSKICTNHSQANIYIEKVRNNAPSQGYIRMMKVTEKQYTSMEVVIGGITNNEKKIGDKKYIKF